GPALPGPRGDPLHSCPRAGRGGPDPGGGAVRTPRLRRGDVEGAPDARSGGPAALSGRPDGSRYRPRLRKSARAEVAWRRGGFLLASLWAGSRRGGGRGRGFFRRPPPRGGARGDFACPRGPRARPARTWAASTQLW